MKKRLVSFLLFLGLLLPLLAAASLSASAAIPTDIEETIQAGAGGEENSGGGQGGEGSEDGSFADDILNTLGSAFDWAKDLMNGIVETLTGLMNVVGGIVTTVTGLLIENTPEQLDALLQRDWASWYNSNLSGVVSRIYTLVYPFGVILMLLSWTAACSSAGLTLNFEPNNRNSLIRAMLQLIIGIFVLSYTPWLLGVTFKFFDMLRLNIASRFGMLRPHVLILHVTQIQMYLSMLRIALLQCISPIFAGCAAGGESLRRFAVNFAKEYATICIEMLVVTIYIILADRAINTWDAQWDLIASAAIVFSSLSISKRLSRLTS